MRLAGLGRETLRDLVCLPGGLETDGKTFLGDLDAVAVWHRTRLDEGMRGLVAYDETRPRGFVEWAPAETAPFPIEAPGASVLLCFHWSGTTAEDPTHLASERQLLEAAIADARGQYSGMAALGWDHPTHFPIHLLARLGFREIERSDYVALMWLPFRPRSAEPSLAPARFRPRDLSGEGSLAIDAAWSTRCPYSIHFIERLRRAVEEQPGRSRISFEEHRIDARDDAFRLAKSPWDWGWVYLNGEEIEPFALPGDALSREIARRVAELGAAA